MKLRNKLFWNVLSIALLTIIFPLKTFAQLNSVSDNPSISFDITEIANFDERIFFLHNLMEDSRFDIIAGEDDGIFVVSANESYENINLQNSFADFREQNAIDFLRMDKVQAAEVASEYKALLPMEFVHSLMMDFYVRSRQNNTCANADPFCTDNGLYQFPAGVNAGSGESGPDYNCLYSTPNPAWYYMRILNPGNIDIYMYSTPSHDIDFCCWGPFDDPITPCPNGLTANKVVSCSYSINSTEHCLIPASAQTGDYFILVITNYSNSPCNISFSKVAGTGTTDCGILPPLVNNDGPYCVGETIYLTASGQSGATYNWSGPGNFSSSQQNPVRTNCTMAMAGTYTCTIAVGSQTNSATTDVVIYPQPTANFNFTTTCVGNATQFNSTSTTNPSGQQIQSYQWNFGDGQTGIGQTTSHTYAQPGTYQVTLTVSTGGHCTDNITQTVTVYAQPTASFTFNTVCQGNATQFTSTSTGQNIIGYQWNFGDGQTGTGQTANHTYAQPGEYSVTLTVQTEGGICNDQITQTVIVNPQPTANFNFTSVCQGTATQFTSTATGQEINNYQWNFGDGQTGTGQTVSHTYAQAGEYQVTHIVTSNGGCNDQKIQTVPVYASPIASATAQPNTVIYGGTATLTANAGTTGSFNFHWEPANLVVNPDNQTTQTVPLEATQTFTVTVTNPQGGCNSSAQVTVSIEGSSMTALASADQNELCEGESTTLHASPSGGTGNYTYNWTPASTLNSATSQNPVATPPVGSTTYTCAVSDGMITQNVSVTIVVHPNEETDIYETICENSYFNFFGEDLQTPGVYDHTIETHYGCDSLIHLHLSNWDIFETPITRHFCQGESFDFFGEPLSASGTYYHTLESVHGCDSVIMLNLVQDPRYEYELFESTCEGGLGYYYNGEYLQPSANPYTYTFETVHGCDSIIVLHVDEAEYNSKSYNVSLCATEYTWASNGHTYYESGTYYDTLSYPNTCDSTLVLFLELRPSYQNEEVITSCDTYHWQSNAYQVDMTFTESTVYTHQYINSYGCDSEVTLYLSINDHDETDFTVSNDENCNEYYWDPKGHEILFSDHEDLVYNMSGTYHRTYKNQADCDSLVTMNVQFEYTPHPTEIYPMDAQNTAPHWVVTATEFQINSYDFNLWDTNPNCHWDSVRWSCDEAPTWVLEAFGDKNQCCRVYVLNQVADTVWLKAHAFNRCAPEDGIEQKYWLVCSFYGVEENGSSTNSETFDFNIIPNPNNGQMTLNFEHLTGKVNVKVYDMRGTLLDKFETYSNNGFSSFDYNMKSKADGIYYFIVTAKEGSVSKKVVIQR